MAMIVSIKQKQVDESKIYDHTETEAEFIKINDNTIQINTYGSKARKNPNKESQTIRINREAALELVNLIKNAFKEN